MVVVAVLGLCRSSLGDNLADQSRPADQRGSEFASWREAATFNARLLSQTKWTPVADTMPNRRGGYFEKGKEYTGVPYSSVRHVGQYIGFDISLRTFLAAVENPVSVLYTENLAGTVSNAACYYGTVCSAYTSYSLQCGIWEVSRHHGPGVKEGVQLINSPTAQSVQVGDIIYTPPRPGSHVEIVTAITRDDVGDVTSIRVEESRPPTTQTTSRSVASFLAHLSSNDRQLFRITDLDAWRSANRSQSFLFPNYELDSVRPTINRTLLLDLGDWVPYKKGQAVKFNVMDRDDSGVSTLVIQRGASVVEEIRLDGTGVVEREYDTCADYTAHVVFADGTKSQACEFSVCDLTLQIPRMNVSMSQEWQVDFSSENMNIIAVYLWNEADSYGRYPMFLSPEQQQSGSVTIPAKLLQKPGTVQVWLIGEHPYGRLKTTKTLAVTE